MFKDPDAVMENICNVTRRLREKIKEAGGEADRETLNVIPTRTGEIYYKHPDGASFRMYKFIESSVSYDVAERPEILNARFAFV